MKKKIILLVLFVLIFALPVFFLPSTANATGILDDFKSERFYGLKTAGTNLGYQESTDPKTELLQRINSIVKIALSAMALVFFALALYAGLRWMIARDNEELATKAKDTLENAIIGLVIIAASYAITTFIISAVGSQKGGGDVGGTSAQSGNYCCKCAGVNFDEILVEVRDTSVNCETECRILNKIHAQLTPKICE